MFDRILFAKTKAVIAVMTAVTMVFSAYLIEHAGVIPGLDDDTDILKGETLAKAHRDDTYEGTITDRWGNVISYSDQKGVSGTISSTAYSYLIGYNSLTYGTSGLKGKYEGELFRSGAEDDRGASLALTVDDTLQREAYNLIKGTDSSVIIMKKDTGEILALASANSAGEYDVNNLDYMMASYGGTNGFFLANGYRDAAAPGSTFKIVTSAGLIEAGLAQDKVNDEGTAIVANHTVVNFNEKAYGEIGIGEAFGVSSNIYYAKEGLKLGKSKTLNLYDSFLLNQEIKLDFTTIKSTGKLTSDRDLLADNSYGQGNLSLTPLHIAMITQAVANDGVMLEPYLIQSVTFNGHQTSSGEVSVLSQTMSAETAAVLQNMMYTNGSDYYGLGNGIAAKTGTAEVGDSTKGYLTSFNDRYVVTISQTGCHGIDLSSKLQSIYSLLENRNL